MPEGFNENDVPWPCTSAMNAIDVSLSYMIGIVETYIHEGVSKRIGRQIC